MEEEQRNVIICQRHSGMSFQLRTKVEHNVTTNLCCGACWWESSCRSHAIIPAGYAYHTPSFLSALSRWPIRFYQFPLSLSLSIFLFSSVFLASPWTFSFRFICQCWAAITQAGAFTCTTFRKDIRFRCLVLRGFCISIMIFHVLIMTRYMYVIAAPQEESQAKIHETTSSNSPQNMNNSMTNAVQQIAAICYCYVSHT